MIPLLQCCFFSASNWFEKKTNIETMPFKCSHYIMLSIHNVTKTEVFWISTPEILWQI